MQLGSRSTREIQLFLIFPHHFADEMVVWLKQLTIGVDNSVTSTLRENVETELNHTQEIFSYVKEKKQLYK